MLAGRELYPELHARPVEALPPVPRDKENACMPTTIDRKTLQRLETLGFEQVFRYAPGKEDWMAAGLPIEGSNVSIPRGGGVARRDVPTCRLDERVGDISARVLAKGCDLAQSRTDLTWWQRMLHARCPSAMWKACLSRLGMAS